MTSCEQSEDEEDKTGSAFTSPSFSGIKKPIIDRHDDLIGVSHDNFDRMQADIALKRENERVAELENEI